MLSSLVHDVSIFATMGAPGLEFQTWESDEPQPAIVVLNEAHVGGSRGLQAPERRPTAIEGFSPGKIIFAKNVERNKG
jgi:hypothetical protein